MYIDIDITNDITFTYTGSETIPSNVTILTCIQRLTSLPTLPNTLTKLYCWGNELTSLPELPPTLTDLNCEKNQLTSLPELPPTLTEIVGGIN